MASLNFPNSPIDGQQFAAGNGLTYVYNLAKTRWDSANTAGALPANSVGDAQLKDNSISPLKMILVYPGRNYLLNPDRAINQRGYGGGALANGTYGYDMWKGESSDANIEQVIRQEDIKTGTYTISWAGGGTASVNGVGGLTSGSNLLVTVVGNVSVIVPKNSTEIKLEVGVYQTPEDRISKLEQLILCRGIYESSYPEGVAPGSSALPRSSGGLEYYPFGSGNGVFWNTFRMAPKIAVPHTFKIYSPDTGVASAVYAWNLSDDRTASISSTSRDSFRVQFGSGIAGNEFMHGHWTVDAGL